MRTAVGLATMRDGSSGGVIRLAVVDGNGTRRELIRPDVSGSKFPTVVEPSPYSHLPPHVAAKQALSSKTATAGDVVMG